MTPQRSEKLLKVLQKRQANLTVVLENVQDPRRDDCILREVSPLGGEG